MMYRSALGRLPTNRELKRMQALVSRFGTLHEEGQEDMLASVQVWRDVAHTIFNLKEFIYIQ